MARLRSFMYIKKSNGSNTDPWGTPKETVDIPVNIRVDITVSKAFSRSANIPRAKLPSSRAFIID